MVEIISDLNFKNILADYKDAFFDAKKYWAIYLFFITIAFLSTLNGGNILHPKFEMAAFGLIAVLGVFSILFYFLHKDDCELHKVAFVVILIFGILCAFATPILFHSDELEHFTRSEITSQGVIVPDWIGDEFGIDRLYNKTDGEFSDAYNFGAGFRTIKSVGILEDLHGETVFTTTHDTDKINYTPHIRASAFEQNPFYGYLPQAIGMFIAKLLDLNVIWLLWLGRIFNLIFYAAVIALAVRIAPTLKMPLMAISCIPVALFHAASTSIDAMIFAVGILSFAYFLHLHQSDENSIEIKHLVIYTALCLMLGLCKLPYLAFIFLLLLVPRKNFKNDNMLIFILLSIAFIGICGLLWSGYATNALEHSWRSGLNYVNSTQQLNYIKNPYNMFKFFTYVLNDGTYKMLPELINFDYGLTASQSRYGFIITAVEAFLAVVLFAYPAKVRFDLKTKLGALFVFVMIYFGTFFVQLLTWAYVGKFNTGVHIRYFIPLFCLIPVICQLNFSDDEEKIFERYTFVFIIGFMAALILAIVTRFY